MAKKGILGVCRHCCLPRSLGARRLCVTCYRDPAVRRRYATAHRYPTEREDKGADMTAEEVEAVIAAQLAKGLPKWWAESANERDGEPYSGPRYGRAAELVRTKVGRVKRKGQW